MNKRKENYSKLRAVGFTAKEATRFKDLSNDKIIRLIELRKQENKQVKEILKGV